jgi:hypothetical protein
LEWDISILELNVRKWAALPVILMEQQGPARMKNKHESVWLCWER